MPSSSSAGKSKWVFLGVIAAIAVAGVVAVLLSSGGSGDADSAASGETLEVSVEGTPLPDYDKSSDPGLGAAAPTLTGTTFDGRSITIGGGGRPQVVFFLAHWCPHCQREVPVITQWIDSEGIPDGVDLLAVSTSVDARRPNYPPSSWLDGEGWPIPTIADDDDSSAADAFGLTGFPFFVAIDADGEVVARDSGELTVQEIEGLVAAARG